MTYTNNTSSPLSYFTELVESNNLQFRKERAIQLIVEKYGGSVTSVDNEKGIVKYIKAFSDGSEEPIEAIATYSFTNEFVKEVHAEAEKAKSKIDSFVLQINLNGNNANQFLISQIKLLGQLIDRSKEVYPKLKFIEEAIQGIVTNLVDKYSLKESYKKTDLGLNAKSSFFDVKPEIRISTLEKLYDTSVDLEIIDDEIISEETFINVLTGNPATSKEVIIFKCNNEIAAHFINSIQPLFNNFTVSRINQSKSFLNKNEKVLNQADLDNANKRLRKKSSSKLEKITLHISRILEH